MKNFPIDNRNGIGKKRVKVPSNTINNIYENVLRKLIRKEIIKLNESGIDKSYKAIMDLEKRIDGLQKIFNREKKGMTRDRARSMEKSIKNLIMAWNRLYADTQER